MSILKYRFTCEFCEKSFAREDRYLAHFCKQMRRDEEVRTPVGQAAWNFYQDWMKSHKRTAPSIEVFLTSRYYNSFIKFAKYAQAVQLPDIKLFIWFMKEKDFSPFIWTSDQVYVNYIEFLDRKTDPLHQVGISVNTLIELAEKYQTDAGNIFKVIHPAEVINLVRERKLSPWLLSFSLEFKQFLIERTNTEQRILLSTLLRKEYWLKKFKQHPKEIEKIKEIIKEMKL